MPSGRRRYRLLYFSGNEWGNMGRRKPRLAHEFARQADVASVLYVEPPVATSVLDLARGRFESGHLASNRRAHANALLGRPRQVEAKVWAYTGSTKTIPLTRLQAVRRLSGLRRLNERIYYAGIHRRLCRLPGERLIVWLSHPLHVRALRAFPRRALACYDWTDDWLQFDILPVAERSELERASERALRQADVVFAVSESLYRRASVINPNTHWAPNATDFELMSQSAEDNMLADPELRTIPRPRLGYIGQIGENIDFSLVRAVAKAHPDWSMIFVGPVWANKQAEVASLVDLTNVHFLGGRPYSQLPGFLCGFDVCLLPHLCNSLTISMDPTKLYDYLASGKPIVSTSVAGTERFADVLYIGDTPRDFLAGIGTALAANGAQREKRLDYARQNSWPRRALEVWEALEQHV